MSRAGKSPGGAISAPWTFDQLLERFYRADPKVWKRWVQDNKASLFRCYMAWARNPKIRLPMALRGALNAYRAETGLVVFDDARFSLVQANVQANLDVEVTKRPEIVKNTSQFADQTYVSLLVNALSRWPPAVRNSMKALLDEFTLEQMRGKEPAALKRRWLTLTGALWADVVTFVGQKREFYSFLGRLRPIIHRRMTFYKAHNGAAALTVSSLLKVMSGGALDSQQLADSVATASTIGTSKENHGRLIDLKLRPDLDATRRIPKDLFKCIEQRVLVHHHGNKVALYGTRPYTKHLFTWSIPKGQKVDPDTDTRNALHAYLKSNPNFPKGLVESPQVGFSARYGRDGMLIKIYDIIQNPSEREKRVRALAEWAVLVGSVLLLGPFAAKLAGEALVVAAGTYLLPQAIFSGSTVPVVLGWRRATGLDVLNWVALFSSVRAIGSYAGVQKLLKKAGGSVPKGTVRPLDEPLQETLRQRLGKKGAAFAARLGSGGLWVIDMTATGFGLVICTEQMGEAAKKAAAGDYRGALWDGANGLVGLMNGTQAVIGELGMSKQDDGAKDATVIRAAVRGGSPPGQKPHRGARTAPRPAGNGRRPMHSNGSPGAHGAPPPAVRTTKKGAGSKPSRRDVWQSPVSLAEESGRKLNSKDPALHALSTPLNLAKEALNPYQYRCGFGGRVSFGTTAKLQGQWAIGAGKAFTGFIDSYRAEVQKVAQQAGVSIALPRPKKSTAPSVVFEQLSQAVVKALEGCTDTQKSALHHVVGLRRFPVQAMLGPLLALRTTDIHTMLRDWMKPGKVNKSMHLNGSLRQPSHVWYRAIADNNSHHLPQVWLRVRTDLLSLIKTI